MPHKFKKTQQIKGASRYWAKFALPPSCASPVGSRLVWNSRANPALAGNSRTSTGERQFDSGD